MRTLAHLVLSLMCTTGIVVVSQVPAHAACDWVYRYDVSIRKAGLITGYKSPSHYNKTLDPVKKVRTSTVTRTWSNTTNWEVGAEGGLSLKVIEAKVSGKYGEAATRGVQESTSESIEMTIRPKYSGWSQLNLRKRVYVVERYRVAGNCGRQVLQRAAYRDHYFNTSSHTREGRVAW